jgi:ABC-type multidrug transport system fused ATPase/permease subunit
MEKMNELIDTKPSIVDAVCAIPYDATTMGTSITLQNVHFAYPNTESTTVRPILQGASFTVPPGTTTAIVGSSGCGKSTILRLLYRSYEANHGAILIGEHNVRDLQRLSLQKSIAVIPQDVVLFNETIGYNINYGNLNATMEQVIVAAKQAKIHDTIMSFPAGYDTLVGERGLKLSGGEKQRVRQSSFDQSLLRQNLTLTFAPFFESFFNHFEYSAIGKYSKGHIERESDLTL